MLKSIKILIVALTALCAVSCLDKVPQSAIPQQQAMQTFDDAIDFARIKYNRMKTGIQSVEITRDDDRSEYEPYSDDDPSKLA